MALNRTSLCVALGFALSVGLAPAPSQAQPTKYPDRPVKVVVGFTAGGGTDVAARVIAQKLSEATGQSFVVENRPGASGLIASEQVAKAPADGYTIMVGSQTTLAVAPALYKKFQFDATKELTGLAMIGVSPLVAVVNADSPIKSIKDLIAAAKDKNGAMNFGSGGVGTTPHMAGELFAFNAGIKMVHVAYRGEAPGINDLLGGQIPFMFSNLSVVIGNIQAGKLRALAVTSAKRVPALPNVPTIAETFPGFDAATWFVLVAPTGTPKDAVMKINAETKKIFAAPDFQQRLDTLGMIPDQDRTPDEINAYIRSEIAKWAKVIQDAGVKPAVETRDWRFLSGPKSAKTMGLRRVRPPAMKRFKHLKPIGNSARNDREGMTRKLYVKSYGCQMNVYDSHRMADTLAPEGYVETATPDDADLIIVNTCHIREKAAEKVYSELGRIRELKDIAAGNGRRVTVAVAGCVAQAEGKEIFRRERAVDLVVGPQSYHRLPAMLRRAEHGKMIDTEFPVEAKFEHLAAPSGPATRKRGVSAFITVQEGCDKFCTFCVVPYTRGVEVSRPVAKIVAEAERLARAGVREITLLGQNVNAYHGEDQDGRASTLGRLMHRLADIPGIARLRYSTSHPRDMYDNLDDSLIAAHRDLRALMPQLHLPVQSGSDRVLEAMNRGHTSADYLRTVEKLRQARPDIAFSSDFIVGFPGETAEDFRDTLRLMSEVGFASAYSFKYSPRPGTPAADMDQLPEAVKDERLQRLQDDIERHQAAFMARCLGLTFDVLFERAGRHPGQIVGRSPYLQPVPVEAPASLIGEIAPVTVTEIRVNSLYGTLAAAPKLAVPARAEAVLTEDALTEDMGT